MIKAAIHPRALLGTSFLGQRQEVMQTIGEKESGNYTMRRLQVKIAE